MPSDWIKNPLRYLNAAHYNNPAVDDLFRQAATEVDDTRPAQQFKTIQTIVGADLPAIALVALPTIVVRNTKVRNLLDSVGLTASSVAEAWIAPRVSSDGRSRRNACAGVTRGLVRRLGRFRLEGGWIASVSSCRSGL